MGERCLDEPMQLFITGISFGDFAHSENAADSISSPFLRLDSGASRSEHGTFEFEAVIIHLLEVDGSSIENLEGKCPLGMVNFYDSDLAHVNICATKGFLDRLFQAALHDRGGLSVRIGIPEWKHSEVKCLPLTWYQVIYNSDDTPENE
ncbi:hypothetical protein GCM10027297_36670 [Parahaliea aestuarii]